MHYLALFLSITGWLLFAIITAEYIVERVRERRNRNAGSARLEAVVSPRKDLL